MAERSYRPEMRGIGRRGRQRIAWSLGLTAREDGDDVNGDDELGLSAGDRLEALGNEEEEGEGEEEVVEVNEEDMKEEWATRGLDPTTFDPLVLLEMWEAEDAEDEETDDDEIDAVMEAAAATDAAGRGASPERWMKERQGFRDMDGGDDEGGSVGNCDDVDAVMAEAAMKSGAERRAGGGGGEGALQGRAVGIDLGTTNSAVAVIVEGKPVMVPNSRGKLTTPSVVSFKKRKSSNHATEEKDGGGKGGGGGGGGLTRIVIGEAAVARIASHPRSTYSSVKRIVGRTRREAKEAGVGLGALNVDQGQHLLRLKCPAIGVGATIPPEDISAEILRSLIRDAERFIGGGAEVRRAVIAVPAYFNPIQCAATERAGQLAGLEKVKLMREPEAAALAYGLDKGGDEIILVFDLGGGTFDVSILEVGGGIAEVIATSGDSKLGGDDFDQAVTEWLFEEMVSSGGGDPRSNPIVTRQLIEAARAARERLSDRAETEVELTFADGRTGSTTLTRSKMEALILEPLKRVMAPIREAAIMADVSLPGETGAFMDYDAEDPRSAREGGGYGDSDSEGDSLRKLRSQQSNARKKARAQSKSIRKQVSSMAEVSRKMEGNAKLRRFPQGRMIDHVVLVGGATRMPCVQKLVAGITGVMPKRTVDPDLAVALGAAAFAGILEGEVEGQEVMTSWQASIYRMMARDGLMQGCRTAAVWYGGGGDDGGEMT
eukprot:jgi/Undpi1/4820/HiC_scaffold_19.g08173.m1